MVFFSSHIDHPQTLKFNHPKSASYYCLENIYFQLKSINFHKYNENVCQSSKFLLILLLLLSIAGFWIVFVIIVSSAFYEIGIAELVMLLLSSLISHFSQQYQFDAETWAEHGQKVSTLQVSGVWRFDFRVETPIKFRYLSDCSTMWSSHCEPSKIEILKDQNFKALDFKL